MSGRVSFAVAALLFTNAPAVWAEPPQPISLNESTDSFAVLDRDRPPHRLRSAIEVGLVLTFATIRYQFDGERKKNWDFPSFKQRFTLEAWRYDNNPFGINNLWHAVEGTFFHAAARSNNLGLAESFGIGFLASFAWEFAFEFKEKVSINDVLFTPFAGVAVGEGIHWLGRYLDSAPPSAGLATHIARWTLGFPYALHRQLDGRDADGRPLEQQETDNLGLRADIWHRFSIAANAGSVSGDINGPSALGSARAAARLVAVRGYRRAQDVSASFSGGQFTELAYEHTRGADADGYRFRAESILAGVFEQESSAERGRAWLAGVALSYDYRREQLGDWRDRVALLHLPGVALEGELHAGSATVRVGARLHGDFASLEAPAHAAWRAANPLVIEKTILRKQGYTFGWGGSIRLFAEASADIGVHLGFSGSILAGLYDSDEGLDRNQETIEADLDVDTTLVDLDASLTIGLRVGLPEIELRASHQLRESTLAEFAVNGSITRLGAGLLWQF